VQNSPFKGNKIPEMVLKEWDGILESISEIFNLSLTMIVQKNKSAFRILTGFSPLGLDNEISNDKEIFQDFFKKVLGNGSQAKMALSPAPFSASNKMKSAYGFPLYFPTGEVFGVFCGFSEEKNKFDEKTCKALISFGGIIETGIKNLFLDRELKKNKKENRSLEKDLRTSQQSYKETLNSIGDGVIVFDPEGNIDFANRAAEKIIGGRKEDLIGTNLNGYFSGDFFSEMDHFIKGNPAKGGRAVEIKLKRQNGSERIIQFTPNPGKEISPGKMVLSFRDVTETRQQGKKMRFLSFHDPLTNLYNRAFLEEEFKRLDVNRQMPTCLLVADLNGLKMINDSFGFSKGDLALKKAADILRKSCRSEDIISRWGGDEFVILLPKTKEEQVGSICSRVKKNCLATEGEEFPISLSLGVAVKEHSGEGIHSLFQKAENRMMENKLLEGRSVKSHILKALLKTLAEKSSETEGHALRMQKMAYVIGEKMGLSQNDLDRLSIVAILHDLGKTIISEDILEKPGPLTKNEWKKIKEHPVTGFRIASSTEEFVHIASLILYHHEWWDGSGYPSGLVGEEIPLLARIISLVDAYDVMTTGRPYKKKMSPKEAKNELKRSAGTQFDPDLVGSFSQVLTEVTFD